MVNKESLVSISEASRILGVSEPALRQWTDEGKVKAFITPGGHRRYSPAELKKLMTSQQKTLGVRDLAIKLEGTAAVHREIDKAFLNTTPWYRQLSEESQKHLASMGRRLLDLIIRYIAEPARRKETIRLARDVGSDFGETLARLGLPLTDSVQAFLMHREPVMNMATSLMKKREAFTERIAGAIPLADHIIDEALVALVAAHQQYRRGTQEGMKGGVGDDIHNAPAV